MSACMSSSPLCVRCNKTFDMKNNSHDACKAHCDRLSGKRGEFRSRQVQVQVLTKESVLADNLKKAEANKIDTQPAGSIGSIGSIGSTGSGSDSSSTRQERVRGSSSERKGKAMSANIDPDAESWSCCGSTLRNSEGCTSYPHLVISRIASNIYYITCVTFIARSLTSQSSTYAMTSHASAKR